MGKTVKTHCAQMQTFMHFKIEQDSHSISLYFCLPLPLNLILMVHLKILLCNLMFCVYICFCSGGKTENELYNFKIEFCYAHFVVEIKKYTTYGLFKIQFTPLKL